MSVKRLNKSYVVCATERTGSGVLCEALWNTGLLGKPDEYFVLNNQKYYSELWGTKSDKEYLRGVTEYATTPNGVFGMKIMMKHFPEFINIIVGIADSDKTGSYYLLNKIFNNLKFIWIRRRDKIRQAISYFKNLHTGVHSWYGDSIKNHDIEFDFSSIQKIVTEIEDWDKQWENFFIVNSVNPLTLYYEDHIEKGYTDTVKTIFSFLSIEEPADLKITANRRKQSNQVSEEFYEKYRQLLNEIQRV